MLKGLNPSSLNCARDPYYSFAAYKPDASSEASTDLQLCARAADFGFNMVLVLHDFGGWSKNQMQWRPLSCSYRCFSCRISRAARVFHAHV